MLKYFIKLFVLTIALSVSAQQKTPTLNNVPSGNRKKTVVSVRLGYDLGKKLWALTQKGNIDQWNLNLIRKKSILNFVYGRESMPYISQRYSFLSSGKYFKGEYSYNFFENWGNMRNEITMGVSYGFAHFDYELTSYERTSTSAYLPNQQIFPGLRFENLSASWVEITSSVKTEIFKRIFLELRINGKLFIKGRQPDNFELIYIPGFYTTNISGFGFGLGYGISYLIF